MRSTSCIRARYLLAGATALLLACSDRDPFEPTPGTVAGFYEATSFTVTIGSVTNDMLAAGASLTLDLLPQGTTVGRLHIPASAVNPEEVDADMAGTWRLEGTIVTVEQEADTFVRNIPFQVTRGRLFGEHVFAGALIRVTLHK